MNLSSYKKSDKLEIAKLFSNVFAQAETLEEGALIAKLVSDLIEKTDDQDILGFVVKNKSEIVGAVFFTRLTFENTSIAAFILSPMAVSTDFQGKGIGQKLIKYGLKQLDKAGVQLVFTYGDPNFYSKVGFQRITEDVIKAPLRLCQSLNDGPILSIPDRPICVDALNHDIYW
jgi:predicted N-acetyltransferase YhbS